MRMRMFVPIQRRPLGCQVAEQCAVFRRIRPDGFRGVPSQADMTVSGNNTDPKAAIPHMQIGLHISNARSPISRRTSSICGKTAAEGLLIQPLRRFSSRMRI